MVVVAMAEHTEGDAAGINPQDLHVVDESKLGETEVQDEPFLININKEGQPMLRHRVFGHLSLLQQRRPLRPLVGGEQDIGVIIHKDGDGGFFDRLQISHGQDLSICSAFL
jgi:hypothetical protein